MIYRVLIGGLVAACTSDIFPELLSMHRLNPKAELSKEVRRMHVHAKTQETGFFLVIPGIGNILPMTRSSTYHYDSFPVPIVLWARDLCGDRSLEFGFQSRLLLGQLDYIVLPSERARAVANVSSEGGNTV